MAGGRKIDNCAVQPEGNRRPGRIQEGQSILIRANVGGVAGWSWELENVRQTKKEERNNSRKSKNAKAELLFLDARKADY